MSDEGHNRDLTRANTAVREQRRAEAEKEWRKNPIKQFASLKNQDRLDRDVEKMLRKIKKFEAFLLNEIATKSELDIKGVRDAVTQDVALFRDEELKPDPNLSNCTIADYLGYLNEFYNVLNDYNAFVGNPVDKPLTEFRDNHDLDADRSHISFNRM